MLHLLNWNQNDLESKWVRMGMENENQNKLFVWTVGIKIRMSWIVINDYFVVESKTKWIKLLQITKRVLNNNNNNIN